MRKYIAPTAAIVAVLGYVSSWATVNVLGTSVSAAPVGNSGWGTTWAIALLVCAAFGLLMPGTMSYLATAAVSVASLVFIANFTDHYYSLSTIERAFVHLDAGFFAALLGTVAALGAASYAYYAGE